MLKLLYCDFDDLDYLERAADVIADESGTYTADDVDDIVAQLRQNDLDELLTDFDRGLSRSEYGHGLVMVATVGRWDGDRYAGRVYDEFPTAWREVFRDCCYFSIATGGNDSRLLITGLHHDGQVTAEVYGLTEEGRAVYEEWKSDPEDARTLERVINALTASERLACGGWESARTAWQRKGAI